MGIEEIQGMVEIGDSKFPFLAVAWLIIQLVFWIWLGAFIGGIIGIPYAWIATGLIALNSLAHQIPRLHYSSAVFDMNSRKITVYERKVPNLLNVAATEYSANDLLDFTDILERQGKFALSGGRAHVVYNYIYGIKLEFKDGVQASVWRANDKKKIADLAKTLGIDYDSFEKRKEEISGSKPKSKIWPFA